MRLTYFGQQNLAGVQRWHIRMASENNSWVVAKNDLDGNWFNADDRALEVTLVPTIWNALKRQALLEDSAYANVNAAIQVMCCQSVWLTLRSSERAMRTSFSSWSRRSIKNAWKQ